MVDVEAFKKIVLSFEGTEEKPHFERTAFTVTGRRIFATIHEQSETANIKLSIIDQAVYCDFDKAAVYPVPNKWGLQGWTTFELKKIPIELITDALLTAYNDVLEKKKK